MRYVLLLIILWGCHWGRAQSPPDTVKSQDTLPRWEVGGQANVNLSQATFINWAAGGENSFAMISTGNVFANYFKKRLSFINKLDMAFGILRTGRRAIIKKTEDNIDFSSNLQYAFRDDWRINGLVSFETQFTKGYNYPDDSTVVSDFMAPAYGITALGIDYQPIPGLSLMLAPVSGKFTFVLDQALANDGAYGVEEAVIDEQGRVTEPGERLRKEVGATFVGQFDREILTNVNLSTKVELFSNYFNHPQNIDISWETTFNFSINKFMSANIFTHLIYDHDIEIPTYEQKNGKRVVVGEGPKTQFKETLGIGVSYGF